MLQTRRYLVHLQAPMRRLGLSLLLLASLALAAFALPQSQANCQVANTFALLQSQIPDRVGACRAPAEDRIELGETTQPTTTGRFVYRAVDGSVSFSDGSQTWVMDPSGQVQTRTVDERFAFEFNGDGLPVVGQPAQQINGPCPTTPITVLAVENFYANLVNEIGGQCVSTTTILSDPNADPHDFQPTAGDVRLFHSAQLVVENGLGYDDFSDKVLATLSTPPVVINAGDVLDLQVGANPHVWYSPGYIDQIRAAVLDELEQLNPQASAYYEAQSAALDQRFGTYHNLVD